MGWVRRSLRGTPAATEPPVLVDGLPEWVKPSVAEWLSAVLRESMEQYSTYGISELTRRVQLHMRLELDWRQGERGAAEGLLQLALSDPDVGLDIVDCVLHLGGWRLLQCKGKGSAGWLGYMLEQGGSVWTVVEVDGVLSLQRRVDETAAAAASAAMEGETTAGAHLRAAWAAVYGRTPNPSEAYREAVRAVEAAAKPTLTPDDSRATLGKMLAALRDAPSKWSMRFTEPGVDPVTVLIDAIGLLWHSQYDRHGQPGEGTPRTVSQHEAEDAVHLAVLLVHWFQSGAVVRT